jgi:hypothetical protein
MRHAFKDIAECVRVWADQVKNGMYEGEDGYCGNVSFRGYDLYSYQARIATIFTRKGKGRMAAISTDKWSVTTSSHQSTASGALDYKYLHMSNLDRPARSRDALVETRESGLASLRNARTWPSWRTLDEDDEDIRAIERFFDLKPVELRQLETDEYLDENDNRRRWVKWDDRTSYFINDMRVPKWCWDGRITVARVLSTTNAEVRRLATELYGGWQGLIDACPKAEMVHSDKSGELWRLPASKEPEGCLMLVKVVNSTPEPDGTVKEYFLRVDPQCRPMGDRLRWIPGDTSLPWNHPDRRGHNTHLGEPQELTAHNAVASTFGLRGEDYAVVEES